MNIERNSFAVDKETKSLCLLRSELMPGLAMRSGLSIQGGKSYV